MKISISCSGGTSRSLHLASILCKRGYLENFYRPFYSGKHPIFTKFFKRPSDKEIINLERVHTNFKVVFLRKFLYLIKASKYFKLDSNFVTLEMIDKAVAKQIKRNTDIIFTESAISLHTIKKAKDLGIISILDRTNSHILYQSELLTEEYAKFGVKRKFHSEATIEKSLKEYNEVDYINVLSTYVKKTFIEKGIPEEKMFVTPSGVDIKSFKQVKKEDKIFRIIFCGYISLKKGVHYLLEAFNSLKLPNSELCLIGTISDEIKPFLVKYQGIFKLMGVIPNSELYKVYSRGSVFVLPSLEEGLAKVIMEAMACGLPVIATTNTGAEDVMEDNENGFIIPIRNVEILKEKILYMYENQDKCFQMGQKAKEKVKFGYTWDDYTDRMIYVYNEILKKRKTN